MTDWDYEERIINDRYSGYKASSRIWKLRADHYLELLRETNEFVKETRGTCPICGWGEGNCAPDCELAEVVQIVKLHIKSGGEPDAIIQSEEELGDD